MISDPLTGSFQIEYQKRTSSFSMPADHCHDSYELYYLLSGERNYFIKDRTYRVTRGDLVFIGRNDLHKTTDPGAPAHERILINFKAEFLTEFFTFPVGGLLTFFDQEVKVISLGLKEQGFVENLLFKMLTEKNTRPAGYEIYLRVLLTELLLFLQRSVARRRSIAFRHQSALHEKISEIVRYINEGYRQRISLAQLAKEFFISPYHLSRTFKDITGFSYSEYLNTVRIKEARKLLRESGLSVTEIAEKTGYESVTHFGRVFKKLTGISPSEYRKRSPG